MSPEGTMKSIIKKMMCFILVLCYTQSNAVVIYASRWEKKVNSKKNTLNLLGDLHTGRITNTQQRNKLIKTDDEQKAQLLQYGFDLLLRRKKPYFIVEDMDENANAGAIPREDSPVFLAQSQHLNSLNLPVHNVEFRYIYDLGFEGKRDLKETFKDFEKTRKELKDYIQEVTNNHTSEAKVLRPYYMSIMNQLIKIIGNIRQYYQAPTLQTMFQRDADNSYKKIFAKISDCYKSFCAP